MKIHRDELSALLRLGGGSARRRRGCPDEEVLAALVDVRLDGERRRRLGEHLADCRHCLGQVGILTRLARPGAEAQPAVPASWLEAAAHRRPGTRRLSWSWAAAAAALLAVALGLAWRPGLAPGGAAPGPRVRAESPAAVASGGPAIVHPVEGATLGPRAPAVRWTPVAGALSYRVRLTGADGTILWQTETTGTEAAAPPSLVLAGGGPYFAWVQARLPDGRMLSSRAVAFRVDGAATADG